MRADLWTPGSGVVMTSANLYRYIKINVSHNGHYTSYKCSAVMRAYLLQLYSYIDQQTVDLLCFTLYYNLHSPF